MTRTTDVTSPLPADRAVVHEGWIASVAPEDATGLLAEAYGRQTEKLGRVTELTQIGSLYPALVDLRLRLYAVVDDTPSDIPDWGRRAVALLTSVLNGCRFCTVGHVERLGEAGHAELAQAIKADPLTAASGDDTVDALFAYVRLLVRRPGDVAESDIAALRAAGWDDLAILDVNNITAYYSYINRVASGLGLTREA
jgi:uncharacterized peroxidase-related enzyme